MAVAGTASPARSKLLEAHMKGPRPCCQTASNHPALRANFLGGRGPHMLSDHRAHPLLGGAQDPRRRKGPLRMGP
eukprot:15478509-Alexandrium_andersonii.AAC.1